MGLREWPVSAANKAFDDKCTDGGKRYVLEGSGVVICAGEKYPVVPNTLVCVRGDGTLRWEPNDATELVLLSPEYRGPPVLPIAGGLLALFTLLTAAALASSSG